MKYTKIELKNAVRNSKSKGQLCRLFDLPNNGRSFKRLQDDIDRWDLDVSHFIKKGGRATRKYPLIPKECPVCEKVFIVSLGSPREQQTCSYGCSNILFRSGENNGNWKHGESLRKLAPDGRAFYVSEPGYRKVCFEHWPKKCAICGWDFVVDVHHIDGDHGNDDPKNLIPLCPNHHKLTITLQYKDDINKLIQQAIQMKVHK